MPTLMIQGTTSDAGKSTVVAALCRAFQRRGLSVAPFKPQNMALNSAVTADGGEIGRAQALQAQAAGLAPTTDMNPILLKPATDVGAQVIIHGKARGTMSATSYHEYKSLAMSAVMESWQRLTQAYDWVLVEGAGSPAEINLRDRDLANMGFAEAADCPVILVADIDRGGVFAHLVGTLDLLSESEQQRVTGFLINRFRGDISLLQSGLDWLEDRTGKPVFGVLPYLHGLHLDAEDAVPRDSEAPMPTPKQKDAFRVIVPVLPRISNHTDFDPLRLHPHVDFRFVGPNDSIPPADLIILPGSKSVRDDLAWLRSQGWDKAIARHLRYGGKVLGICGGYQMLGETIADKYGIEGEAGTSTGLGWLAVSTDLLQEKTLINRSGRLTLETSAAICGYEIHVGETTGLATQRPLIEYEGGRDGTISEDNQVAGSYWHGLFESPEALQAILQWAGMETGAEEGVDINAIREAQLDRLADCIEDTIDLSALIANTQSWKASVI